MEASFRRLHEAFLELTVTLSEDQPLTGQVSAVQRLADSAENLRGMVREGLEAATLAGKAIGPPHDLDRIRRSLNVAQSSYNRLIEGWISELSCYERIEEVCSIGRERGRQWEAWVKMTRSALDGCQKPLAGTAAALHDAWRELADRGQGVSVTVSAAGVGRQYNAAGTRSEH
jgi:hypothetical protein